MKKTLEFAAVAVLLAISASAKTQTNSEAQQCFEQANELLKRMDYEGAIIEYNKVVELSSGSKIAQDAQYWIGQSQYRAGKFDAAQATFAKLIETYPTSAIIPVAKIMVERAEQAKKTETIRAAMSDTATEGYIIDPSTAVKYTKAATFTGKNDVIKWSMRLGLSPNGKFLLHEGIIVPLDGSGPFDLVDIYALRAVWSPDGTKVAFYSEGAICVVPVSPLTGRATGPVRKLLQGHYWYQAPVRWSSGGKEISFGRYDKEHSGEIWTLSVIDGSLNPGEPAEESVSHGHTSLPSSERQWSSPSGRWILYEEDGMHLLNVDDNRRLDLIPPPQQVGSFFSWSPDGKKMLFYRESYDFKHKVRILSASGGPTVALEEPTPSWPWPLWSADSKAVFVTGYRDGRYGVWISALSGGDPVPVEIDFSVSGDFRVTEVSPMGDELALVVDSESGTKDLYVIPIALKDAHTTGPAVRVFQGWHTRFAGRREASFSPDGTRLAVVDGQDIWIAFSNGDKPVPLVQGIKGDYPGWSPDGTMVEYMAWPKEDPKGGLYVTPSRGGNPTKIPGGWYIRVWSPDSRNIAVVSKDLGSVSIVAIQGSQTRELANVKDVGFNRFSSIDWSPDGKYIAAACTGHDKGKPGAIILIPLEGSKPTVLATDDDVWKTCLRWSPDGKWLSYRAQESVKVRSEGTLWEADFEEIINSASR